MAYTVESRTNNPATELRDRLDLAERQVVVIDKGSIEEFLLLLDAIEIQMDELADGGMDVRPEAARWQSLLNRLDSRPEAIVRAGTAAGGWPQLRAQHPPAASFWWQLDIALARRRRRSIRRVVVIAASVIGLVLFLLWIMNTFFPPDPETLMIVETTSIVEQLVAVGEWDEALRAVEETRAKVPDDPELALWEVVLSERIGDQARAETVFAEVKEMLGARLALLWVTLGNFRLQTGDVAGAEAAAQTAIDTDEQEPQGYFLMANVAEVAGDMQRAADLYNKTFDLAEEDNPQLAVIAKVRLAQLLQQPAPFPVTPDAQETPTTAP